MVAALGDDAHVAAAEGALPPRGARCCGAALERAGFRVDHSEAGLYLWATRGRGRAGRPSAGLADRGILVAPGDFYGAAGARHVRVALTATDERIARPPARSGCPDEWPTRRCLPWDRTAGVTSSRCLTPAEQPVNKEDGTTCRTTQRAAVTSRG